MKLDGTLFISSFGHSSHLGDPEATKCDARFAANATKSGTRKTSPQIQGQTQERRRLTSAFADEEKI
jgi:hypothetical protein